MFLNFLSLCCALLVLLAAASPGADAASPAQATPTAQTGLTTQQWRDDLKTLAADLRTHHPNPFYKTPEPEFQRAVNELDAAIPQLTRDQIVAGFIRIAAMIDGHTNIRFWESPVNFHLYPLRLYEFSDGILAIDATAPYSQVVGARLMKIGDMNVEDAYPRISAFAMHDNASTVKLLTPLFMVIPEVLNAQGIVQDTAMPRFVFEKTNGERITLNPKPVTTSEYLAQLPGTVYSGLPKRDAPLMQARRDEGFWYTFLAESKTLYVQYNRVRATAGGMTLAGFAAELGKFVNDNEVARVVVDVRHNGGGDNTTYYPLLNLLRENLKINQRGKLFLITGRQTFSAAANFSTDVEQQTNALFAGEPMGGSPNLYGDTRPYLLPNSKISVHISARTWIKSRRDDPRSSIEPQIPIELSSQDYFAKRDPVLDAILKYKPDATKVISPTVRVVAFQTNDGATLNGTLYGNGTTAVIFSNMGANHQDTWSGAAERVAQRGYLALTYDNRYWTGATTINGNLRVYAPDDLRAAVRFVRAQGAQRIVLVGASLGSMASAKVAADMNPAAVVLMASPVDRKDLPFLVTGDDIRAIASPKLFMVAERDELGFTNDVKKMYEISSAPKALELFKGTAHGTDVFKTSEGEHVLNQMIDFFETHVPVE